MDGEELCYYSLVSLERYDKKRCLRSTLNIKKYFRYLDSILNNTLFHACKVITLIADTLE